LVEQFDAKPAEIRGLLRGDLNPTRSRELMDAGGGMFDMIGWRSAPAVVSPSVRCVSTAG
jgi:hypothetical protein